jgi:RNA polymerase sigma factor (sigma-70 family)
MVVATVQSHADDLLRVARRYSLCADDAYEAYQRALEIYVRHARRLEADSAHRWLFTVLKHEAMAVRRQRGQLVGTDEPELDRLESRTTDSPEDRVLAADDVARHAAALRRLKPDEIRALWLKASGLSYAEIMDACGWTYTKVNRCLAEGRASLARHVAEIESGAECEQYLPLLSRLLDGEASRKELRPLRAHLKTCAGCRGQLRSLHQRGDTLGIVLPAGVLTASAATDAAAVVPGLLTRLYETLATTIHDRAAMSAIKLQAAVEATSTGKLAAVAASAAAVASGGAVAATDVPDRPTRPVRAKHERATPVPRTPDTASWPGPLRSRQDERASTATGASSAADRARTTKRPKGGTEIRPATRRKRSPRPVSVRGAVAAASSEFGVKPSRSSVQAARPVEVPTGAPPPASPVTTAPNPAEIEFSP